MGKSLWTFRGYSTEADRQIVQEWYDSLPDEDYEELQDILNYLGSVDIGGWKRPKFAKVQRPLYEVRSRANAANHEIRLYGVFDDTIRGCFLFLHGVTAKKKSHDKKGQDVSLARLGLLKQRKASTHEFIVESRSPESNPARQGSSD